MSQTNTSDAEPLSRDLLFRLVGPVIAVTMSGLLSTTANRISPDQSRLVIQAAILTAVTAAVTAFAPWKRLPRSLQAIPPLVYMVVAFLIREAAGGGGGYSELVLLPVVWAALYGSQRELLAILVGAAIVTMAPVLLPGTPRQELIHALFMIGTAALLGIAVQQVFGQMRVQANRLHTLAREDELTCVANRRAWDEELERGLAEAAARQEPTCVAVLDLDHFKEYNDLRGHPAGDRLLKEITAAWAHQLRRTDVLARMGGDEFAVLLRGCGPDAATTVMQRLCAVIPDGATCSAGIAFWDGAEPSHSLLARADQALYRAKNAGRNRVEVAWADAELPTVRAITA